MARIAELSKQLGEVALSQGVLIATAESCTAGAIAAAITDTAGSSAWFDAGFVTYSVEAKQTMLGVSALTLKQFGAVSQECASEMTAGALAHSLADVAVAVTGIAGPSGEEPGKPVGTVFIAWQRRGAVALVKRLQFKGDRLSVRAQTVEEALSGLITILS